MRFEVDIIMSDAKIALDMGDYAKASSLYEAGAAKAFSVLDMKTYFQCKNVAAKARARQLIDISTRFKSEIKRRKTKF
jgi:3-keto-L-gulonate-6-phosphate decarboxylase